MTSMDRDELEEIIRRVIAEDRAEQIAHPGHREKVTTYTDGEGQKWISVTLGKTEVIRKFAAFFLTLVSVLSLFNYAIVTYAIRPEIHAGLDARMAAHEADAAQKMEKIYPTMVTRAEFDRRVAMADAKWIAAEERYNTLNEWLTRIEAKLDRLIERR